MRAASITMDDASGDPKVGCGPTVGVEAVPCEGMRHVHAHGRNAIIPIVQSIDHYGAITTALSKTHQASMEASHQILRTRPPTDVRRGVDNDVVYSLRLGEHRHVT